jgi:hypothetical protein
MSTTTANPTTTATTTKPTDTETLPIRPRPAPIIKPYSIDDYNHLATLIVAERAWQATPDYDKVVTDLGTVFVKHGLQNVFGMILLHNHFPLYEREKLVHFDTIALPVEGPALRKQDEVKNLMPLNYRFMPDWDVYVREGEKHGTRLGVYEWCHSTEFRLPDPREFPEFVDELQDVVLKHHVQELIGLVALRPKNVTMGAVAGLEFSLGRSNVTLPISLSPGEGKNVDASWVFEEVMDDEGTTRITATPESVCWVATDATGSEVHTQWLPSEAGRKARDAAEDAHAEAEAGEGFPKTEAYARFVKAEREAKMEKLNSMSSIPLRGGARPEVRFAAAEAGSSSDEEYVYSTARYVPGRGDALGARMKGQKNRGQRQGQGMVIRGGGFAGSDSGSDGAETMALRGGGGPGFEADPDLLSLRGGGVRAKTAQTCTIVSDGHSFSLPRRPEHKEDGPEMRGGAGPSVRSKTAQTCTIVSDGHSFSLPRRPDGAEQDLDMRGGAGFSKAKSAQTCTIVSDGHSFSLPRRPDEHALDMEMRGGAGAVKTKASQKCKVDVDCGASLRGGQVKTKSAQTCTIVSDGHSFSLPRRPEAAEQALDMCGGGDVKAKASQKCKVDVDCGASLRGGQVKAKSAQTCTIVSDGHSFSLPRRPGEDTMDMQMRGGQVKARSAQACVYNDYMMMHINLNGQGKPPRGYRYPEDEMLEGETAMRGGALARVQLRPGVRCYKFEQGHCIWRRQPEASDEEAVAAGARGLARRRPSVRCAKFDNGHCVFYRRPEDAAEDETAMRGGQVTARSAGKCIYAEKPTDGPMGSGHYWFHNARSAAAAEHDADTSMRGVAARPAQLCVPHTDDSGHCHYDRRPAADSDEEFPSGSVMRGGKGKGLRAKQAQTCTIVSDGHSFSLPRRPDDSALDMQMRGGAGVSVKASHGCYVFNSKHDSHCPGGGPGICYPRLLEQELDMRMRGGAGVRMKLQGACHPKVNDDHIWNELERMAPRHREEALDLQMRGGAGFRMKLQGACHPKVNDDHIWNELERLAPRFKEEALDLQMRGGAGVRMKLQGACHPKVNDDHKWNELERLAPRFREDALDLQMRGGAGVRMKLQGACHPKVNDDHIWNELERLAPRFKEDALDLQMRGGAPSQVKAKSAQTCTIVSDGHSFSLPRRPESSEQAFDMQLRGGSGVRARAYQECKKVKGSGCHYEPRRPDDHEEAMDQVYMRGGARARVAGKCTPSTWSSDVHYMSRHSSGNVDGDENVLDQTHLRGGGAVKTKSAQTCTIVSDGHSFSLPRRPEADEGTLDVNMRGGGGSRIQANAGGKCIVPINLPNGHATITGKRAPAAEEHDLDVNMRGGGRPQRIQANAGGKCIVPINFPNGHATITGQRSQSAEEHDLDVNMRGGGRPQRVQANAGGKCIVPINFPNGHATITGQRAQSAEEHDLDVSMRGGGGVTAKSHNKCQMVCTGNGCTHKRLWRTTEEDEEVASIQMRGGAGVTRKTNSSCTLAGESGDCTVRTCGPQRAEALEQALDTRGGGVRSKMAQTCTIVSDGHSFSLPRRPESQEQDLDMRGGGSAKAKTAQTCTIVSDGHSFSLPRRPESEEQALDMRGGGVAAKTAQTCTIVSDGHSFSLPRRPESQESGLDMRGGGSVKAKTGQTCTIVSDGHSFSLPRRPQADENTLDMQMRGGGISSKTAQTCTIVSDGHSFSLPRRPEDEHTLDIQMRGGGPSKTAQVLGTWAKASQKCKVDVDCGASLESAKTPKFRGADSDDVEVMSIRGGGPTGQFMREFEAASNYDDESAYEIMERATHRVSAKPPKSENHAFRNAVTDTASSRTDGAATPATRAAKPTIMRIMKLTSMRRSLGSVAVATIEWL